jgi:hypothetical protein
MPIHVRPVRDSYRGLLFEIERRERDSPIVLVSPTKDGEYLVNAAELQQRLIGVIAESVPKRTLRVQACKQFIQA